ncbi:MAG: protein-L-isoaspartate(D-aspartate) O-methyltransferase [Planctomycetota bacterium]
MPWQGGRRETCATGTIPGGGSVMRGGLSLMAMLLGCGSPSNPTSVPAGDGDALRREAMVREQIAARGVEDARVLDAMRKVPRHLFVPDQLRAHAYRDHPLPIGHDQTISQPYIVAVMTEALHLRGDETVLEVGTGSGYQAAVLAELVRRVYSIEIVEPLAASAARTLRAAGYTNVEVRAGDGYAGWPAHAPFDAVLVTAAPDHVPEPLLDQLRIGGRMVLPIGRGFQDLIVIEKGASGLTRRSLLPVTFVPMTGEATSKR